MHIRLRISVPILAQDSKNVALVWASEGCTHKVAYRNGSLGGRSLARQLAILVYSVWHSLGTVAMETSHYMMPILFPHEAALVANYIEFLIISRSSHVLALELHEIHYSPSDISLPAVDGFSMRDDIYDHLWCYGHLVACSRYAA